MKKIFFSILLAVTGALAANAQGTLNFVNSSSSLITVFGASAPASANIYVDIVWAPLGTLDNALFRRVPGTSVQVGVPILGRFSGGTRTIPAGTGFDGIAPGAVVSCIVRAWDRDNGLDFESSLSHNTSSIFTVDTGDPTSEAPGTLNFESFDVYPIPEPAGIQFATLALVAWALKRRLHSKEAVKSGSD